MKPLLAALAALAVLSPAVPASAATTQVACVPRVSAAADGDVYGAGSCSGDAVTLYRRSASGGGFRTLTTAWKGFTVEDVADDGSATFVLLHCQADVPGTCPGSDPLVGRYAAAKLPHGGRPSAVTLLGDGQAGGGSIAASGGRWVAAYAAASFRRSEEERASSHLELRGTAVGGGLGVTVRPQHPYATPEPYVTEPAVALTASGAVFAYLERDSDSDPSPELRTGTVDAARRVSTAPFAPAAGAPAGSPAVAASGGRVFVAWSRAGRLALAHDGVRQDLPVRGTASGVALAASGGKAFLLDQEAFAYDGSTTARVYLRTVTLGGSTTTTELSAAAGRADSHVRAQAYDVTAARGLPTAALFDGARNVVVSP